MTPALLFLYLAATGAGLLVISLAVVIALGVLGWILTAGRPRR